MFLFFFYSASKADFARVFVRGTIFYRCFNMCAHFVGIWCRTWRWGNVDYFLKIHRTYRVTHFHRAKSSFAFTTRSYHKFVNIFKCLRISNKVDETVIL